MAYCENCGNQISDQAAACPGCGHPGPAIAMRIALRGDLATYGQRVAGALVDFFVVWGSIAIVIFAMPARSSVRTVVGSDGVTSTTIGSGGLGMTLGLLFVLLATGVLYKPLMEGTKGQTLGKMWARTKVVRSEDAGPIDLGTAFLRWFIYTLFKCAGPVSLVNLLWPLWDDDRQTLHDKAARTIVVSTAARPIVERPETALAQGPS